MCLEFSTIHLNAQWLNISEYANSHEYMKEKHGEREKRLNMCLVPLCCDFSILTGVLVFTCIYSKKNHIKHYRWNVCPLFLKKHGKHNLPNLTAISLQWTTDALKAIVGKIYGKSSLSCNIFSTKNMVNKQTSKSHCNSLDMTHWMFLKRLWTEFMDRNLCFATFFRPTHGEKTLLNLIAIVWTWPTECFWSDCRING